MQVLVFTSLWTFPLLPLLLVSPCFLSPPAARSREARINIDLDSFRKKCLKKRTISGNGRKLTSVKAKEND